MYKFSRKLLIPSLRLVEPRYVFAMLNERDAVCTRRQDVNTEQNSCGTNTASKAGHLVEYQLK